MDFIFHPHAWPHPLHIAEQPTHSVPIRSVFALTPHPSVFDLIAGFSAPVLNVDTYIHPPLHSSLPHLLSSHHPIPLTTSLSNLQSPSPFPSLLSDFSNWSILSHVESPRYLRTSPLPPSSLQSTFRFLVSSRPSQSIPSTLQYGNHTQSSPSKYSKPVIHMYACGASACYLQSPRGYRFA